MHDSGYLAVRLARQIISSSPAVFACLLLATLLALGPLAHGQVIEVPAPKKSWLSSSEPTKTLYRATPDSQGVLVFIPGGYGQVSLRTDRVYGPQAWGHLQFFADMRSRARMDLVLMDSPYVVQPSARWGGDHVDRIRSVVEAYRQRLGKPIYLYGHSLGGTAVSGFLKEAENEKLIEGAIFSAAQTPKVSREIHIPILVLHNTEDACSYTPASTSKTFFEEVRKINSARTELRLLSGGSNLGDVCTGAQSTHAYFGIYPQLTQALDDFLLP